MKQYYINLRENEGIDSNTTIKSNEKEKNLDEIYSLKTLAEAANKIKVKDLPHESSSQSQSQDIPSFKSFINSIPFPQNSDQSASANINNQSISQLKIKLNSLEKEVENLKEKVENLEQGKTIYEIILKRSEIEDRSLLINIRKRKKDGSILLGENIKERNHSHITNIRNKRSESGKNLKTI